MKQLFTVEYDNGEMIDVDGDGGYSVWLSRAEAQDALDTTLASIDDPDVALSIVEYTALEAKP